MKARRWRVLGIVRKCRIPLSWFFICLILFQNIIPVRLVALTSGPTQPEVQGFEPVETSDMVDLFSGDFNYNIPLLDVDGYPINLSYHSGATMDQEASWVGLGWNINVGTINRILRGIPDDFAGDVITKRMNIKSNKTIGLSAGANLEELGFPIELTAAIGAKFNTYNGIALEKSVNASLNCGDHHKGPLSAHLGVSSSTDEGITIQPSLTLSGRIMNLGRADNLLGGITAGAAFNSRAGLKQLSFGASIQNDYASTISRFNSVERHHNLEFNQGTSFNIGMPTYMFTGSMPLENFSITGNFKAGGELPPTTFPNGLISGYYVCQRLASNSVSRNAYGYLNLDEGMNNPEALLDFNRENDGEFIPDATPSLPITNLTNDIYIVTGQGISGSYRPMRSEVGYVYDPSAKSTDVSENMGFEVGLGTISHGGEDISATVVNNQSGSWEHGNVLSNKLKYKTTTGDPLFQKYSFLEAGEMSVQPVSIVEQYFGGFKPVQPLLLSGGKFNVLTLPGIESGGSFIHTPTNFVAERKKRNQVISIKTRKDRLNGFGIEPLHPQSYPAPGHHISEIDVLGKDGSRYIYGIAAYNTLQEEVSFAVGDGLYSNSGIVGNAVTGLIENYPFQAASIDNSFGLDHYFSKDSIPAYAHSYLLTEILSSDYVDADQIQGPSENDLGTYTRFFYSKYAPANFKWKSPLGKSSDQAYSVANFNEGLKSDPTDDKANYIYGEKELWYIDSIVTKNYIAIFDTRHRLDGLGVQNENGSIQTDTLYSPKQLVRIRLYSRPSFKKYGNGASAIKVVNFKYDNSLCPGLPNALDDNGTLGIAGKLSLKEMWFSYQFSHKGRLSPYKFSYASFDPAYNARNCDRWGNYKGNPSTASWFPYSSNDSLSNADYPYVVQDSALAAKNVSAWQLETIQLPSGGKIKVTYESDDYAFVQDQRAGQMFKVVGYDNQVGLDTVPVFEPGSKIYFRLQPGYGDIKDYSDGLENIYFKFLMKMTTGASPHFDFVSGYGVPENGSWGTQVISNKKYGYFRFQSVHLSDHGTTIVSPMTRAAIQFARLYLSRIVYSHPGNGNESFGLDLLNTLVSFLDIVSSLLKAVEGPNGELYSEGIGKTAVMDKSWIRLNSPGFKKLGGGSRVKQIIISDEWALMTDSMENSFEYGQNFSYRDSLKHSTGVASYEPQLGGDENSLKQPVFFDQKNVLAPDNKFYQEKPIGECFYPNPTVGYARVTVTSLKHPGVTRHATGKVVHEFYTAKDFPVISTATPIDLQRDRTDPASLSKFFDIDERDYLTVSQGFCVELNDMHGKVKRESVYQEGQNVPISSIEYVYQRDMLGPQKFRLNNNVQIIHSDGTVSTAEVGVIFEMVGDMREEYNESTSGGVMLNIDVIPPSIPLPTVYPIFTNEKTQFRSATLTKVIQRFGILKAIIKKDLGSVVEKSNLAYDAENGKVLLTKTTTNFNDSIYTLNFPAYWYYDQMGQAYRNIDLTMANQVFNNGEAQIANAARYFSPGDELGLYKSAMNLRGWVTEVGNNSISVADKAGHPVNGTFSLKILRSGRRNLLNENMASIISLSNPLNELASNHFQKVLQADARVYSDNWKTFCDCFPSQLVDETTNPFILGTKGNWRINKELTYLSPRSASYYDDNTNIRNDGVLTSFSPYYLLSNSSWIINSDNWTQGTEVTEFSPSGQQLEIKDALGRFSSAIYGFNQTLPVAVADNCRYSDIGVESFEDDQLKICADNHFKFPLSPNASLDTKNSHTGKTSLKITNGSVVMNKKLALCPSPSCSLQLTDSVVTTSCWKNVIGYSGTCAGVQYDYTILKGSPSILFFGKTLEICSTDNYSVQVTVIDSAGCKAVQVFNH